MEGAQAIDGVGRFEQAVEGEVELVPVGHGDEQEADRRGAVALEQQIAQGVEVVVRLRHLAAFDEQEADVHPVAGEGVAGGALGLGDLVLVVREHEVLAAGVEVDVFAEELGGHGGALDVPAGAAGAEGGLPVALEGAVGGGLDRLPEGEVAGGVLVVLVDVDAGAVLDAGEVLLGELAVVGEAVDAEVPAAVLGLVGDVLGGELLDERDHLGDGFGGAGQVLGALDGERVHVLEEGLLEAGGVLLDGLAGERGVADDLVVDVGDVHDVLDLHAELAQEAAEDVDVEEGAEVADVAVVVDGGAAGVHAQGAAVDGRKGFGLQAERVEEMQGRRRPAYAGLLLPAAPWRSSSVLSLMIVSACVPIPMPRVPILLPALRRSLLL